MKHVDYHHTYVTCVLESVEELDTLPVDAKPRTSHHQSPGGEKCGKRNGWTIFLERTRTGHRESDQHLNCSKVNAREPETSERQGGAHMGFPERINAIFA